MRQRELTWGSQLVLAELKMLGVWAAVLSLEVATEYTMSKKYQQNDFKHGKQQMLVIIVIRQFGNLIFFVQCKQDEKVNLPLPHLAPAITRPSPARHHRPP